METKNFDVVIIGAGIVGSMVARRLSKFKLSVAVLEKEVDVGMGQSTANSAILHSGHDPEPGTMKAKMNKRGNELWKQYAPELGVEICDTGALVVAMNPEEKKQIKVLYERSNENGIEGVEMWSRAQALAREPHLSPECTGALWTPTAGVIDPFEGVVAAAEHAALNGVQFFFNTEVEHMVVEEGKLTTVKTNRGDFHARWFVNAAGIHSDEIMHMVGDRPDFVITARRGEYMIFDKAKVKVSNVIFPMPTENGKGILVSVTAHGNTLIGPNAHAIEQKEDTAVTKFGLSEILEQSKKVVPTISAQDVIATFSGVRATGNYCPDGSHRDFLIEISKRVKGLINLAGIESPGYVSSPAIAEEVERLLREEAGESFEEKKEYQPTRQPRVRFAKLSHDERAELIRKNPAYGRIVCRCEEVTEGEIVAAIHAPIPAVTYDAIKRRTWLGTGRCQGSFDYPRTMEILSRELNIPMTEITKRGPGSVFLFRKTKEIVEAGGTDGNNKAV
ncbi:NAD(P)/FAD-dependent oxidoreductase [Sediminispirochaeta smaragdinae]|uniref:FAD dependent oxidoreductase n=1 Tax=Sediminispirochaeta smaragdinae (strain DSM 11293 / JCM 15392 / SEBR 4228) TaxID=573413 RepID=E1R7C6_SEDSS|nr:NAD(P)/FAD-dependent oxidoreductase [Sediminispirochaeta smaragdinae]ADK82631.1 FAD dependent oxidoreductase [Sediminispirochaeta smaragdinae DSM 11293]